jgi:hypothetical protein
VLTGKDAEVSALARIHVHAGKQAMPNTWVLGDLIVQLA